MSPYLGMCVERYLAALAVLYLYSLGQMADAVAVTWASLLCAVLSGFTCY